MYYRNVLFLGFFHPKNHHLKGSHWKDMNTTHTKDTMLPPPKGSPSWLHLTLASWVCLTCRRTLRIQDTIHYQLWYLRRSKSSSVVVKKHVFFFWVHGWMSRVQGLLGSMGYFSDPYKWGMNWGETTHLLTIY